ncbi:hypothetical protein GLAREA_01369 [Glarea lozoyensis ATCC 20868]|uniref:Uncharacterized protein n=1 Tax=Glarea lozoyensis (strain ATCC 20868 / MF5171) TaxID=1116229 RepID=S3CG04_GLAL2|nr:uncharacterized protein GLAREA_01369 [Glarea lozoyensis ATCC 20868]EPE25457.1 hypothetical protein GLAREA_01369 [Glarea lozoyensis ATCC 20868]
MLVPYCVVIVLNFYFRFAVYENGTCRIGMTRGAAIPLLTFDFVVNIYMTCLFLLPLRGLLSYKIDTGSPARTVAQRTFIGSLGTLISSIVNLTVMVVLNGEPGWICLMCCNIDILFSVLVLHWITSKDNASTMSTSHPSFSAPATRGQPPSSCPPRSRTPHPDINSYDMGLEYMAKGGVTTLVTASHDLDDDDIEKISGMPMANNVIKVQCEHTREVVDLNDSRGLESSGSGSMDDWCNKCEDDRV